MKQLTLLITALILTTACQRSVAQTNNAKVDNNKTPMVEMVTNMGTLKIKLYDNTPQHRDNFIKLVEQGFYDSVLFALLLFTFPVYVALVVTIVLKVKLILG